jgi:hypothetical protein
MALKLFGFKIGKDEAEKDLVKSFVPPSDEDGAVSVTAGGIYGTYVDLEGQIRNDADLVSKYREMSTQPECDTAIDDIVNEAIVYKEDDYPVEILLDGLKQPDSIKKKISDEFNHIMKLLDFGNQGYDIFRKWYVDGRLYYHMIIDEKNPRAGLKEVRYVDPRKIRKVKELTRKRDPAGVVAIHTKPQEYFIYSEKGFAKDGSQGLKIAFDSICYVHSGIFDKDGKVVLSNLHKAIKPLNQLRMLEDATVIYRISRAPERRIFYIDVGNLPKIKAEQYLREIMQKYKNKLVYDAQTGEIRDDRRFQTMLEDFWLPRREGGKGTEITTLPAGQNLGEIEDVLYFQKKLYKSMNVPISRLEADNGFSLGRTSEITRDEIKFNKFVVRLRLRFSHMFDKMLETQLLLKGVCTRKEWQQMREEINYKFNGDQYFSELKESEIMKDRIAILTDIDQFVGKYFSIEYVRKNILRQTEEDIKEIDDQMEEEVAGAEETTPTENDVQTPPVQDQTESFSTDDTDQRELAKSMTRFFETLTEESNENSRKK